MKRLRFSGHPPEEPERDAFLLFFLALLGAAIVGVVHALAKR